MNPSYHEGRCQARAQALYTTLRGDPAVICTDAAQHRGKLYAIIVATTRTNLLASASLKAQNMTAPEDAAIALALSQPGVRKVVTDSQKAYRNYQSGWVSRAALRVLKNHYPTGFIHLIWTPAHASIEGYKYAHQQAGAFTPHAMELREGSHSVVTLRDITHVIDFRDRPYPLPTPTYPENNKLR